MKTTIKLDLYNTSIILNSADSKKFIAEHRAELDAIKSERNYARRERIGTHLVISADSITNIHGESIREYKGTFVESEGLKQFFTGCAEKLAKNNIILEMICVKNASNFVEYNTMTDVRPVEENKLTVFKNNDRYIWYKVIAKLNGKSVSSGWMCYVGFNQPSDAVRMGPREVVGNIDRNFDGMMSGLISIINQRAKN